MTTAGVSEFSPSLYFSGPSFLEVLHYVFRFGSPYEYVAGHHANRLLPNSRAIRDHGDGGGNVV